MAPTHLDLLAETLTRSLGFPEGVRLSFDEDAPRADPEALAQLGEAIEKIVLGAA